jgi:hypothetical protein
MGIALAELAVELVAKRTEVGGRAEELEYEEMTLPRRPRPPR